jgi:sugar-specific transcriptional regulator TrmB
MTTAPCTQALQNVADVPPSAKEVFCALFGQAPMTGAELRDATGLPRRTVYSALRRLKDNGLLKEQLSLRDTRQTFFWIDPTAIAITA